MPLAALAGIESAQTVVETLQVELAAIRTSLERAKLSAQEIAAAAEKLVVPSINIEELEGRQTGDTGPPGIVYPPHCCALARSVDSGGSAVRKLRELLEKAGDAHR